MYGEDHRKNEKEKEKVGWPLGLCFTKSICHGIMTQTRIRLVEKLKKQSLGDIFWPLS